MARHIARRDPRAHWLLLLLGLAVLLAALCFNGLVTNVAGGAEAPRSGAPPAPLAVTRGGPVIRLDGPRPESRSMPAMTVALTFDGGPDPRWTPQVLDVLRRHRAHATFFLVGSQVDAHPELVRRIVAEGHEIGSATFTHPDLTTAPGWRRDLELSLTRKAIAGVTGQEVTLFRPPFSATPAHLTAPQYDVLREAARDGHVTVLADRDARDWARPGVGAIVSAATPERGRGAVVLLHDGGGDRSQTVAALDRMIPALAAQGYRFTTISQGLGATGSTVPATTGTRLGGTALRYAQVGAAWVTRAMNIFLALALVLGIARLAVQVVCARIHLRRVRRARRDRPEIVAPVSVIVPAYNEAANIAATVRSLVASAYPALEVIVVDDGSSDGTADIVERLGLRGVRVIRQANAGKPAALNTGVRAARADLVVLVDGDTVFQPDTVARLVQGFADPGVGAISGNTKVANRRGLLGRWQHLEYVIGFNLDRRMYDVLGCMPTVPGAIGAFRREVLLALGGVPGDTLAEDTDLTMKVLRAGWRVVYEESAIAWTEAPSSLRQLWRQRYRWCYGTMQAMWKHRHALREPGSGGRLGRRGLPYLTLFQVVLPLTAPAVDIFALYGLLFLPWSRLALAWVGLLLLQGWTAAYALRLDRERLGPLWSLPFQQLVYRQVMYLVVVQSVVTALLGNRLRWQRMARTGGAAALVTDAAGPTVPVGAPASRVRPPAR